MILRALIAAMLTMASLAAAQTGWDDTALPAFDPAEVPRDPVAGVIGIVVKGVDDNGPAGEVGLRPGDRVIGLDGRRIWGDAEYQLVRAFAAGPETPLELSILRAGVVSTLRLAGKRPRTGGFGYETETAALDEALAAAGLLPDRTVAPLAWRAWRAFPPRLAAEVLRWHRSAPADLAGREWLVDLDRRWRACVVQDFAAAAAGDRPPAPTPTLEAFAAFLQTVARRQADGERPPDPAACGVSAMTFVLWYPWPLVMGAPVGAWPEADFATLIEDCRQLPAALRADRQELSDRAFALPLSGQAASDHYLSLVRAALVDPERHGGWPYRAEYIAHPEGRKKVISELESRTAADPWAAQVVTLLRLVDDMSKPAADARDKAIERLIPELTRLEKVSPWLATRYLEVAVACSRQRGVFILRREFRAAFAALAPAITPRPSPLLDHLRARDPGHLLWQASALVDDGWPAATLLRALVASRPIAELEAEIVALPDEAPALKRRALIEEFLVRHRGVLDWVDAQRLRRLAGEAAPLACGALVDLLPEALLWHGMPGTDQNFWLGISTAMLPSDRDFDLSALDAGVAAVPWREPAKAATAVEALRLRLGHPLTALRLADACASRGLADAGDGLRTGVRRHYAAALAYFAAGGFPPRHIATLHWEALMVFASSPATAGEAIEHGRAHLAKRSTENSWTCAHLSLAQAQLALGRHKEAAEHLAHSFVGIESAGREPFVGPFGLMRGEPAMRTWVLEELAKAGALPAARTAILAAAKPALLTPRALELLGASADQLGNGGVPVPGASDF